MARHAWTGAHSSGGHTAAAQAFDQHLRGLPKQCSRNKKAAIMAEGGWKAVAHARYIEGAGQGWRIIGLTGSRMKITDTIS